MADSARGEKRIWIFSGTTEGRELALWAAERGLFVTVSVVSAYGSEVMPAHPRIAVRQGRLSAEEMAPLLEESGASLAVDATHPFATAASGEIRAACERLALPCLRLRRETGPASALSEGGIHFFSSASEAGAWLSGQTGGIYVTTGSKELPALARALGGSERLTVRVLPSAEALAVCAACGIPGARITAMQGPFSEEMNLAMLRAAGARFLLTKESGAAGGFAAKVSAAERLGVTVCAIRNPERGEKEARAGEDAEAVSAAAAASGSFGVMAIREELMRRLSLSAPVRELALIGTGPGAPGLLTREAAQAIRQADVLFGAEPVLRRFAGGSPLPFGDGAEPREFPAERVAIYRPAGVYAWLLAHPAHERAAVLFSGDVGFYSGAALFYRERDARFSLRALPGISAAQLFAARLRIPLAGIPVLSCHGRREDYAGALFREGSVLLFVSGAEAIPGIAEELRGARENGLISDVRISAGRNLSLEDEELARGLSPEEAADRKWPAGSYLLYLTAKKAKGETEEAAKSRAGLPDSAFLRDRCTPMTKENIRALILRRLALRGETPPAAGEKSGMAPRCAVCWDIGAGTGSVTVEAALSLPDGRIVAIERAPAALEILKRNVEKFRLRNVTIAAGDACEILREQAGRAAAEAAETGENDRLPAPTHAFIGGSGGRLREIAELLFRLNPRIRIVLTAVTTETQAAAQEVIAALPVSGVRQTLVAVTEAEPRGGVHLMRAENPVWIISFDGAPAGEAESPASRRGREDAP